MTGVSTPKPEPSVSHGIRPWLHRTAHRLNHFPATFFSRGNQIALDLTLSALAVFVAFQIRFEGAVVPSYRPVMWMWVLILPVLRVSTIYLIEGYTRIWRYFSFRDALKFSLELVPPTICVLILRVLKHPHVPLKLPIGIVLIEFGAFLLLAVSIRGGRRLLFETGQGPAAELRRAIIIGSDISLANAVQNVSLQRNLDIVGLLAPEARVHGARIRGVPVLGSPEDLAKFLADGQIDLVLVADSSLTSLGSLVEITTEFGLELHLLPSATDVLKGNVRFAAKPNPDSIFSREINAIPPSATVLEAYSGRTVLVTGAGGSIGSELSMQVSRHGIRTLVLVDHDENSIFEIHSRLRVAKARPELVQVVGDIRDVRHMRQVFAEHRPDIVLHAAAFKHVPVMEVNRAQAVLNNVIGTRNLLDLSIEFCAERFLMISTDKAVHPTSIMGATKRLAEMLVQYRAQSGNSSTRCACVRFGNVVGSRGSVVPIFLRQIAAGGPVTITHEQMTRYFMTINEAVNLVLQAASLGSEGDIYMLDMGDPVKIANVARRLIEMSGLRPDEDIKIEFVGIREGEKLHEQLWPADATVTSTELKQVYRVHAPVVSLDAYDAILAMENISLNGSEDDVMDYLHRLPIGFKRITSAHVAAR